MRLFLATMKRRPERAIATASPRSTIVEPLNGGVGTVVVVELEVVVVRAVVLVELTVEEELVEVLVELELELVVTAVLETELLETDELEEEVEVWVLLELEAEEDDEDEVEVVEVELVDELAVVLDEAEVLLVVVVVVEVVVVVLEVLVVKLPPLPPLPLTGSPIAKFVPVSSATVTVPHMVSPFTEEVTVTHPWPLQYSSTLCAFTAPFVKQTWALALPGVVPETETS